jgi:hypothetical protein
MNLWNLLSAYAELQGVGPAGLRARVAAVLHLINGEWQAAWDDFKGYVETTWEAIKTILNVDAIEQALRRILDLINQIRNSPVSSPTTPPNNTPPIITCPEGMHPEFWDGGWVCIGNVTFASGTNFAPGGMALVGEYGPELVNLPRGSQVATAAQTAKALTGNTWNVTINTGESGVRVVDDMRYLQMLGAMA